MEWVYVIFGIILWRLINNYRYVSTPIHISLELIIRLLHIFTFFILSFLISTVDSTFYKFFSAIFFGKTLWCIIQLVEDMLYYLGIIPYPEEDIDDNDNDNDNDDVDSDINGEKDKGEN